MKVTIRDLMVSGLVKYSDMIMIRKKGDHLPYYTGQAIDASTADSFKQIRQLSPAADGWHVVV